MTTLSSDSLIRLNSLDKQNTQISNPENAAWFSVMRKNPCKHFFPRISHFDVCPPLKEEKKSVESDVAFPDMSTFCLFFIQKCFTEESLPHDSCLWTLNKSLHHFWIPLVVSTLFPEAKEALAARSHSFAIILSNNKSVSADTEFQPVFTTSPSPSSTSNWIQVRAKRETKLNQQKKA